MNRVVGHALILGAAALGAGLSIELIAADVAPARVAALVVTGSAAPPAAPTVMKPVILDGGPMDREQLTRALQRELRRLGCYAGEITGAWGPSSRHAMRVFTDKLQVRLPIEEPDHVLLKLVQEQQKPVCTASAEPKLIVPPTEAKRPPSKRPAALVAREETAAPETTPPQRSGSMLPRAGTYAAPSNRNAGASDNPPPKFVRSLMQGVAGALSALELP